VFGREKAGQDQRLRAEHGDTQRQPKDLQAAIVTAHQRIFDRAKCAKARASHGKSRSSTDGKASQRR
jgi:hypothetical protein